MMFKSLFALSGLALLAVVSSANAADKPIPNHPSFNNDVMPVLQAHCTSCHVADGKGKEVSGFSMESYDDFMKGTKHGSVIVAGDASMSNLMRMIEGEVDASITMPHGSKQIPKRERNIIRRWINDGAMNN